MNLKDKNNKPLSIGSIVEMPDPNPGEVYDEWNHSFVGSIDSVCKDDPDWVYVSDSEDELFVIKADRLALVED